MLFANLPFLWAVLAGGVPVLLHLIFRRKRTTLKYPTLMFFRRVDMKLASRRKLKEILLLILRALAVICAALALARPVIPAAGGGGAGPADCVLIMDNSASMGLPSQTGTRLDLARGRALALLSALSTENRAALLTLVSDDPANEVSMLDSDKERTAHALRALYPTNGAGSLTGALARAKEIFARTSGSMNREIYIFSDLQANLFRDKEGLAKTAPDRVPLAAPFAASGGEPGALAAKQPAASGTQTPMLFLCPVPAAGPKDNLSIIGLTTDPRPKVTGRTLTIAAKVKNNCKHEMSASVTATLGDAPQKSATVTLPAGAEQEVPLMLTLGQEGFVAGEVRLDNDDVPYDNVWPFCIEIRGPLRVLVLSDSNSPKPEADEAFFLLKALDPTGDSRLSGIRVDHLNTQRSPKDLTGYDGVILCGCGAFKPESVDILEAYLQRGGGVIIFAGAQDPLLAANHPLRRLLGGTITGELRAASAQKPFTLQAVKPASPFFDDSRGAEGRVEFKDSAIFHALHIQPAQGTEILAQFSDGHPAILIHAEKQGRVMWWAISPHADDSNLPLLPQFLALLHRSVAVLSGAQAQTLSQKAGVPLTLDLAARLAKIPGAVAPAAVTIFDPAGKSFEVPVVAGRISWPQTGRTGIYRLEAKAAGKPSETPSGRAVPPGFAITPDPDESTPEYLSAKDALKAFAFPKVTVVDPGTDLRELLSATRQGRELFGYFLVCALLAVLAEVVLANMISVKKIGSTGKRVNG